MDDDAEKTEETNSDADDLPDYIDIDSDNDGIFDVEESGDSVLDRITTERLILMT